MQLYHFRTTTTPKLNKTKIKNIVIKKFFFRSGNSSVSRAPCISITGTTALNNKNDETPSKQIITNLTINDEIDDMGNGATKNITIINNAIPINIQENLVCSLYSMIYRLGSSKIVFDILNYYICIL